MWLNREVSERDIHSEFRGKAAKKERMDIFHLARGLKGRVSPGRNN